MRRVVGCAVFVGLIAAAGIVFLKKAQLSGEKEIVHKENTRRGACQRFVRAMADGDLATMQRYAHDTIKDKCQDLIDRFAGKVAGPVQRIEASYPDGQDPYRVMIVVDGKLTIDCWVREVGGRPLVSECRF